MIVPYSFFNQVLTLLMVGEKMYIKSSFLFSQMSELANTITRCTALLSSYSSVLLHR